MFKKVASDALGLSDIGRVIGKADYDKVDADDYVMHEEGEQIYFLIKSRMDEYCFTNVAFIHVDGTSAVSKKRTLKRYEYKRTMFGNVFMETAGTIDRDVEIKFQLGDQSYSIDVDKNQVELLKDLYKALIRISTIQQENLRKFKFAESSLQTAAASVSRSASQTATEEQFKVINQYSFDWLANAHNTYMRRDFSDVFEKFINN